MSQIEFASPLERLELLGLETSSLTLALALAAAPAALEPSLLGLTCAAS